MLGIINEKANTIETIVQGHVSSGRVNSVRAHPTRQIILSTSSDRTARIWDLEKKVLMRIGCRLRFLPATISETPRLSQKTLTSHYLIKFSICSISTSDNLIM